MTKVSPTNLLSAAGPAGTNGLRDIKPPVAIPSGWAWLGWVLAALVVAGLLFWAWRYWQKRRAKVPPVPIIPPHVRARQKLQQALALIGQPREFCILVSDTIRWYLEERFDFHAPERTTEEFLYELQGTNLLAPDQKSSLGEFLNRCDLVKFAKYEPGEPELRDLHAAALRLVEETEPIAPPPSTNVPPQSPTQNPKPEIRKPKEIPTPKSESQPCRGFLRATVACLLQAVLPQTSVPGRQGAAFGFRISDFGFRPSFGLRTSDFGLFHTRHA